MSYTKLMIRVDCRKFTCGKCKFPHQHSNAYPNDYSCTLFGETIKTKGEWRKDLIKYRVKACLEAEII